MKIQYISKTSIRIRKFIAGFNKNNHISEAKRANREQELINLSEKNSMQKV